MSLDKSIQSGKERRKKFRGSKAFDHSCRNHGSCPWCLGNRVYKNSKRKYNIADLVAEHKEYREELERDDFLKWLDFIDPRDWFS